MPNNTIRVYWHSFGGLSKYTAILIGVSSNYSCRSYPGGNSCDITGSVCGEMYTVVVAPLSRDGAKVEFCPRRRYSGEWQIYYRHIAKTHDWENEVSPHSLSLLFFASSNIACRKKILNLFLISVLCVSVSCYASDIEMGRYLWTLIWNRVSGKNSNSCYHVINIQQHINSLIFVTVLFWTLCWFYYFYCVFSNVLEEEEKCGLAGNMYVIL